MASFAGNNFRQSGNHEFFSNISCKAVDKFESIELNAAVFKKIGR
jgi:hypothetical protein